MSYPKSSRLASVVIVPLLSCGLAQAQHYTQTNLTSSVLGAAALQDPDLKNPWGLSRSSGSPWWVADADSGLSTLYDGTGKKQGLVVTVPAAQPSKIGSPAGTIFNGSATDFLLGTGAPAKFLFSTLDGTISGWNPSVQATTAVVKWNPGDGSSYPGLTSAVVEGKRYLYAANWGKGRIDVFDTAFKPVTVRVGQFEDDDLPFGFSPYNIQLIGENLYVAYAELNPSNGFSVRGNGLGVVDVFSVNGKLLYRLEDGEYMNAPWALVMAPSDFGRFSHDILVGQFGSGNIVAFNAITGDFEGYLEDANGEKIVIPGLWALSPGNNASAGSSTLLYFTALMNFSGDGLFGTLAPVATDQVSGNDQ